jgi:hypothetical protein
MFHDGMMNTGRQVKAPEAVSVTAMAMAGGSGAAGVSVHDALPPLRGRRPVGLP